MGAAADAGAGANAGIGAAAGADEARSRVGCKWVAWLRSTTDASFTVPDGVASADSAVAAFVRLMARVAFALSNIRAPRPPRLHPSSPPEPSDCTPVVVSSVAVPDCSLLWAISSTA